MLLLAQPVCLLLPLLAIAGMLLVAQTLYLFLPLLVAAGISGIVLRFDWLRALARPIDFGAKWRGKRLLGDGKTWRGVVVAVGACVATAAVQKLGIGDRAGLLAVVDYASIEPLSFGAAMAMGAMVGELPNSFVKRADLESRAVVAQRALWGSSSGSGIKSTCLRQHGRRWLRGSCPAGCWSPRVSP